MRSPFLPPPPPGALEETPVHVAVRDYPELLPGLRAHLGSLAESGCAPVGEVVPPDAVGALAEAVAWRARPEGV